MAIVTPVAASLYAALLGLLAAVLTVRVIMNRVRTGIQAGAGLTIVVVAATSLLLLYRVMLAH